MYNDDPSIDAYTEGLALRAEANLLAAIRVWAAAASGGELFEVSGVLALRVDAPLRAFNQAIEEVTDAATRLIRSLKTNAPPRNREEEARKAKERAAERYA